LPGAKTNGGTSWIPGGTATIVRPGDAPPVLEAATSPASTSVAVERSVHKSTPSMIATKIAAPTVRAVAPAINRPTRMLSRTLYLGFGGFFKAS